MKSTTGMQCLFAIHVLHAGISFAQPMSYNVMGKRAPPGTAFKCPDGGAAKGQNRGDGATPYSTDEYPADTGMQLLSREQVFQSSNLKCKSSMHTHIAMN